MPMASVAVIQTSDNSLIYNEFSAYVTDLEYTGDGSRLFYTQGDYHFVHVSDFSTVAVSRDSRRLYVSLADGKTVEVIDTATNAVLGYFTVPATGAMTAAPDGTLYFTDYANGKTYAVTVGSTPV
jgi:DNA-binding beta-propeller fold protein YncE